jgi:hypothetical protein
LFDPIKQQIIFRRNIFFDEKSSRIKLLNDSPGILQDDPFDIIANNGSYVPFFRISIEHLNSIPTLTEQSIFVFGLTSHHSSLTKIVTSLYRPSEVNVNSLSPCLP